MFAQTRDEELKPVAVFDRLVSLQVDRALLSRRWLAANVVLNVSVVGAPVLATVVVVVAADGFGPFLGTD